MAGAWSTVDLRNLFPPDGGSVQGVLESDRQFLAFWDINYRDED